MPKYLVDIMLEWNYVSFPKWDTSVEKIFLANNSVWCRNDMAPRTFRFIQWLMCCQKITKTWWRSWQQGNVQSISKLFRNMRFALNKMFQRNASKFAIFYFLKNFIFFLISCNFTLMKNDLCIKIRAKLKLHTMKNEKEILEFSYKYNFWSILLEHFIEHKSLISEESVPN